MSLYLVRHARAGSRQAWKGPDELRPLSKVGRKQAAGIARARAGSGITRIVSSPFVRCQQTVEPLAKKLDLEIELREELAEGALSAEALRLLEKLLDQYAVVCSHGDVLGNLLDHVASTGLRLNPPKLEKASTWVLEAADGEPRTARYVPPPKT
jgi:8-oxo-dGTP diphosphatase